MAKTDFKSVAEYLATLPKDTRTTLQRVRNAIRKAVPEAEECISYQIPTLKLEGRAVIYFAGWKHHYSLYPATQQVVTAFERELAEYELRKGTIIFPLSAPVPSRLIAAIAKLRAGETRALLVERPVKQAKAAKKAKQAKRAMKKRATPSSTSPTQKKRGREKGARGRS